MSTVSEGSNWNEKAITKFELVFTIARIIPTATYIKKKSRYAGKSLLYISLTLLYSRYKM